MTQYIIVFIIISAVLVYTVFAVIKGVKSKEKSPCDGCGGCDLKNTINGNCDSKY